MCEWFNFSASSLAFDVIHFNFCHSERYVVISYCVFLKNIFIIFDLQCCANFYCTAKRPSHTCKYIYIYIYILFLILSSVMFYPKSEYSSLYCTVGPHYLSILNVIVCIYQPQTPSPPHSLPPPPWQPQVYSLYLWVCFYFVCRFICAIF